jgi:hypothetical protein
VLNDESLCFQMETGRLILSKKKGSEQVIYLLSQARRQSNTPCCSAESRIRSGSRLVALQAAEARPHPEKKMDKADCKSAT